MASGPSTNAKGPHSRDGDGSDPVGGTEVGYPTCGAKAKSTGKPCTRPAGWGTDHPGEGRCKFHGGVVGRQLKGGQWARMLVRPRVREIVAEMEAGDEDPTDMRGELFTMRALLVDYVERTEKEGGPAFEVDVARQLITEASKIAKRMEDVRAQNAISRRDFYRVITEMGRVVDELVEDPAVRKRIRDHWLSMRLG